MKKLCRNFVWSIREIWDFRKKFLILSLAGACISGVLPVISLSLTQRLINMIQIRHASFRECAYMCAALVCCEMIGTNILQYIGTEYQNCETQFETHTQYKILHKASTLACKTFEDSSIQDVINRTQNDAQNSIISNLQGIMSLISAMIGAVSYIYILGCFRVWVLLLVVLFYLVRFRIEKWFALKGYSVTLKNTENERKAEYMSRLLLHPDYIKEIKTFGVFGKLLRKFREARLCYDNAEIHLNNAKLRHLITLGVGEYLVDGFLVFYLVRLAFLGKLLFGSFFLYNSAIDSLKTNLTVIIEKISDMYKSSAMIEQMDRYYHLEDEKQQNESNMIGTIESIELRHVSYHYENSTEDSLKDVSLLLRQGEKMVLLGANGSGKTTLLKIILGIYQDYTGTVLVNGIDLRLIDMESYRRQLSAVFQDYIKYETNVRDNINCTGANISDSELFELLSVVHMRDCFDDLNSPLGYQFNHGRQLSIGQWQKLAFLRAFCKKASLMVLDEPNSAIDMCAENDMFSYLDVNRKNKIMILVLHRFHPVVEDADKIMILSDGHVTDAGTHQVLLKRNSFYRKFSLLDNNQEHRSCCV
ncbi:MAG: ATP-binding cassette domain-containing protein [Chordicoccus sp.]